MSPLANNGSHICRVCHRLGAPTPQAPCLNCWLDTLKSSGVNVPESAYDKRQTVVCVYCGLPQASAQFDATKHVAGCPSLTGSTPETKTVVYRSADSYCPNCLHTGGRHHTECPGNVPYRGVYGHTEGIAKHWAEEERKQSSTAEAVRDLLKSPHSDEWAEVPESLPASDELRLHCLGVSW